MSLDLFLKKYSCIISRKANWLIRSIILNGSPTKNFSAQPKPLQNIRRTIVNGRVKETRRTYSNRHTQIPWLYLINSRKSRKCKGSCKNIPSTRPFCPTATKVRYFTSTKIIRNLWLVLQINNFSTHQNCQLYLRLQKICLLLNSLFNMTPLHLGNKVRLMKRTSKSRQ
jgi:hypothetical protein